MFTSAVAYHGLTAHEHTPAHGPAPPSRRARSTDTADFGAAEELITEGNKLYYRAAGAVKSLYSIQGYIRDLCLNKERGIAYSMNVKAAGTFWGQNSQNQNMVLFGLLK